MTESPETNGAHWIARLRRRGVFRVAASYAVIAWLLLQIADVVLEPLGAPAWSMRALITLVVIGFPVAALLAWFYELTDEGIQRDRSAESEARPAVHGVRRYADLVVIAVLLGVIAVLLARQPAPETAPTTDSPVVAVLPFKELGGAKDSFFGYGLADTLIHKLGQLDELVVLTSNSTFEFAGEEHDRAELGAKLGASVYLEGTVQQAGGRLRVNTRLVEVGSGRQLWTDSYERPGDDLFAVQDEIALAVSQSLSVVLSPRLEARLAKPVTASISAYDAYTLGRLSLARRGSSVREAIEFFRQAIQLDPDFALAHAALAEALYMAPFYLRVDTSWEQVAGEARAAANAALRIDPGLGEAYLARFYVAEADNRYGDGASWSAAQLRGFLEQALARNPNHADAARYVARYAESAEERLRLLERAARLDPRSGIIAYDVSNEYAQAGDFGQARAWALRSGATADPYFAIGYNNVAIISAFYAGQLDEGARWVRLFARTFGGNFRAILYSALWDLGAAEEAQAVWDGIASDADPSFAGWLLTNQYITAWKGGSEETAAHLWERLEQDFLSKHPTWPELYRFPGSDWLLSLRAITDLRQGHPGRALERYRTAFPDPTAYPSTLSSGVFLDPVLMTGALLKANGQGGAGRGMLQDYLAANGRKPIVGRGGVGFGRFIAHALLGDAAAASREMQAVLDAPFAALSWQLELARFDPDFEAVITDPLVEPLYQELEGRVTRMREAYLRDPELPQEILPERFRDTQPDPS